MSELFKKIDKEQVSGIKKGLCLQGKILKEIEDLYFMNPPMAFGILEYAKSALNFMNKTKWDKDLANKEAPHEQNSTQKSKG